MGKAARRKRARRQPLYLDLETHIHPDASRAWLDEFAKIDFSKYEARIAAQIASGKLGTFQGTTFMNSPMGATMAAGQQRRREHPLEGYTIFKLVEKSDKRFGHVAVYKVNTKAMGQIMAGEHVPDTDVWVRPVDELTGSLRSPYDVMCIAWCRRNRIEDIQHAVAWVLMQDKVPVVVRAFEP